jgi:hypothetical protein
MPSDARDLSLRLAVVLPANRLWRWHERLVAELTTNHAVAVFIDDRAPAYPWPIRAWLQAELALYREELSPSDALHIRGLSSQLQARDFDLIIDLGERPSVHARSLALRYDGALDSTALIDALLARRSPRLAACEQPDDRLLAQSRLAVDDKTRLTRGLQLAFGRCIALVGRALRADAGEIEAESISEGHVDRARLSAHIGRFCIEKARRLALRRLRRENHWSIALRQGAGPFMMVPDDGGRYFGDPFLFAWQGRTHLFVEELPYATGRGVISAAEIVDGRLAGAFEPVLERPYHLSYPFVLADGDSVHMLPESSTNGTLELYRAIDFPMRWQLDRVLIEGLPLADATPVHHRGRWWLFAAAAEHGTTDHDELLIFHSERLTGPWRPHARNPVKSDCRSARPAGRLLQRGGRLLRPAQDCERAYGAGIVWHEITELTPEHFSEREIACWDGRRDLGVAGIHSFDQLEGLQVIDLKRTSGPGYPMSLVLEPRAGSALERAFPAVARAASAAASGTVGDGSLVGAARNRRREQAERAMAFYVDESVPLL